MTDLQIPRTGPLMIASQLPAPFNAALAARLQGIEIHPVPPGKFAGLPDAAEMLLVVPGPETEHAERPSGWPFQLRWIQSVASGIDSFPDWLLTDLPVVSGRGPSAGPVAEFALAAIFAAAKRLPEIWIDDARKAKFGSITLENIAGKTLGLVGFGAIGRALAVKALALGMQIVAVRRSDAPFDIDGVVPADTLAALFQQADHVVLLAPATPATRHIINRDILAQAKPGLHLINVGRGSLVDTEALLAALDDGSIGLATLDVTDPEPLPPGHPFYTHPRVRLSPHVAVAAKDLFDRAADMIAGHVRDYLAGRPLRNVIDICQGY